MIKKLALFFSFLFMLGAGLTIAGSINGFGVDSAGYVYIGEKSDIKVYSDSELIRTVELLPHRTYYFAVQDDDTILLSNSDYYYILDLYGNQLACKPEFESEVFNQLHNNLQKRQWVTAANGEMYRYQNVLGLGIVKNSRGEIIYRTPLDQYLSTSMFVIMIVCLCFPAVIFITQAKKQ